MAKDQWCIAPASWAVFKQHADPDCWSSGSRILTFPMTEYTSRCPTLLWDVFSSTSNSFLTWFCNSLVTVRFHSSLVHRGHTQYENIVYKSKGPQSVFPVTFITVLHICTYLVGALRWYAVHSEKPCALYLKSLVCSSFCPSITQIRGKDQEKKEIFFFFTLISYAVGYMNASP